MAALILGNLGSSLLGPIGGFIFSAIGSLIDQFLFSPRPPDQKGPQIEDLSTIRADPSVPIPLVFGADRIPGIVIASTELVEVANKRRVGKWPNRITITTYTYHVDIDFMLCEGPILGIGRIWAEGTLARGARYDLDPDTEQNPEKIGGLPYPRYYLDNLHDPKLIPWTLDRSFTPTDDGKYYIANPQRTAMREITEAEANNYLATSKIVVYWQDTATGYFIPIKSGHAYGYKATNTTQVPADIVTANVAGVTDATEGPVDLADDNHVLIDLLDFMSREDVEALALRSATVGAQVRTELEPPFRIAFDERQDVSLHFVGISVSAYAEGNVSTVDGTDLGEQLFIEPTLATQLWSSGPFAFMSSYAFNPIPIPAGARYIKIAYSKGVIFPFFVTDFFMELNYSVSFVDNVRTTSEIRDWPDYWNLYDAINDFSTRAVLAFKGVDNITVYHGTMDQQPDAVMAGALQKAMPAYIGRAHVVMDRLELAEYGNRIPNFSFEVIQYDDARPRRIIREMMERANVGEEYYDVSGLRNEGQRSHALGYTIGSRSSFRAALETLCEAFRIDVAEIGNELVFRQRDRDTDWVIPYSDLAARESKEDTPSSRLEFIYRDQSEMPKSATIRYKDVEREYQVNTQHYHRQQTLSTQESVLEVASVLVPAIAKQYARDKMRDVWLERISVRARLPHKYAYIYPTDRVLIQGEAEGEKDVAIKVVKQTRGANGVIEIEGVVRETVVYEPLEGEIDIVLTDKSTWNHSQVRPGDPPPTRYVLLDLPPLIEFHEDLGFYYAAQGDGDFWRGSTLMRSVDDGDTFNSLSSTFVPVVMGYVVGRLGAMASDVVDMTTRLFVRLFDEEQSLSSTTITGLFNSTNAAVVGKEIIQFLNAELQTDGTWLLTGLIRGRRGTLRHTNTHVAGERFTLIESATFVNVRDDATNLNQEYLFKSPTNGTSPTEHPTRLFTNTGERLKPLPVAGLRATRDMSNNVTIAWWRSDRVYQAWTDGADIPNSESIERYEIDVYDDPTYTTIVATLSVEDAQEVEYTAAQITADGLDPTDRELFIRVYQISATVGRGAPATARV